MSMISMSVNCLSMNYLFMNWIKVGKNEDTILGSNEKSNIFI